MKSTNKVSLSICSHPLNVMKHSFLMLFVCACAIPDSSWANDLTATMHHGQLFVRETNGQLDQDNSVSIYQSATGIIRIEGSGDTLINGLPAVEFVGPRNLNIDFGSGNDLVVFGGGVFRARFNNVSIEFDQYDLQRDRVIVWGLRTRSLEIVTGNGDDWVFMEDTVIESTQLSSLFVWTGAGGDTVHLNESDNIHGYAAIYTGEDDDVVWLENSTIRKHVQVETGGDSDTLHMSNMVLWDDLRFGTGAGIDTCEIINTLVVGDVLGRMGDGNDIASVDLIWCRDVELHGEAGWDRLTYSARSVVDRFVTRTFEIINGRFQWNQQPTHLYDVFR